MCFDLTKLDRIGHRRNSGEAVGERPENAPPCPHCADKHNLYIDMEDPRFLFCVACNKHIRLDPETDRYGDKAGLVRAVEDFLSSPEGYLRRVGA